MDKVCFPICDIISPPFLTIRSGQLNERIQEASHLPRVPGSQEFRNIHKKLKKVFISFNLISIVFLHPRSGTIYWNLLLIFNLSQIRTASLAIEDFLNLLPVTRSQAEEYLPFVIRICRAEQQRLTGSKRESKLESQHYLSQTFSESQLHRLCLLWATQEPWWF